MLNKCFIIIQVVCRLLFLEFLPPLSLRGKGAVFVLLRDRLLKNAEIGTISVIILSVGLWSV